jgi:hypothetical protein
MIIHQRIMKFAVLALVAPVAFGFGDMDQGCCIETKIRDGIEDDSYCQWGTDEHSCPGTVDEPAMFRDCSPGDSSAIECQMQGYDADGLTHDRHKYFTHWEMKCPVECHEHEHSDVNPFLDLPWTCRGDDPAKMAIDSQGVMTGTCSKMIADLETNYGLPAGDTCAKEDALASLEAPDGWFIYYCCDTCGRPQNTPATAP